MSDKRTRWIFSDATNKAKYFLVQIIGGILSVTDEETGSAVGLPVTAPVSSVNSKTGIVVLNNADIGSEPALGNPSISGQVLASTTGGARSWVTAGGGGGIADAPADGQIYVRRNNAWEVLNIS